MGDDDYDDNSDDDGGCPARTPSPTHFTTRQPRPSKNKIKKSIGPASLFGGPLPSTSVDGGATSPPSSTTSSRSPTFPFSFKPAFFLTLHNASSSLSMATSSDSSSHIDTSSSLDAQIQRQRQDYDRSITIVIWYKAHNEPIRLQHMNPTFPYFQLLQLPLLVSDLNLSPSSYLDAYDPLSGKWEQHNIATVRVVSTQQRLLYKIRRSLLQGLTDSDCLGLCEEVQKQQLSSATSSTPLSTNLSSAVKSPLKRLFPDTPFSPPPPSKVHIPNHIYPDHSGPSITAVAAASSPIVQPITYPLPPATPHIHPIPPSPSLSPLPPSGPPQTYPQTHFPATSPPTVASIPVPTPDLPSSSTSTFPSTTTTTTPSTLTTTTTTSIPIQIPIPHHPHPPLKRWPNDYTVAELTAGFHAMELLMRQPPPPPPPPPPHPSTNTPFSSFPSATSSSSSSIPTTTTTSTTTTTTQRAAFERVFGSRYVKSTVCRHRGVWRRAEGTALRAEFEAMGSDERACWGEFVRRIEGRGQKSAFASSADLGVVHHPVPIAPRIGK